MDNLCHQDRSTVLGNILFRDIEFQPCKWPRMHRKAGDEGIPKGTRASEFVGSLAGWDPEHGS